MAETKYLNNEGLRYLWVKLKELFGNKVDKEDGKGLSSNDFTDQLRRKLENISEGANQYVHPTYGANTGKPETNKTPQFGEAVTVSQIVSDENGHVSQMNDRTITIPDTAMKGATSRAAGARGLVPAPESEDAGKFLRGDGTWAAVVTKDENVSVKRDATHKAYLLGTTTEPTGTAQQVTAVADTGVYLDEDSGGLTAKTFTGSGANLTNLDAGNLSKGTVPLARLPDASESDKGAMSASDKRKLNGFDDASTYAKKSDITTMYRHKGSVNYVNDLASVESPTPGDVYNVRYKDDGSTYGMNYVFVSGREWDPLGELFVIDSITNADIDNILRS